MPLFIRVRGKPVPFFQKDASVLRACRVKTDHLPVMEIIPRKPGVNKLRRGLKLQITGRLPKLQCDNGRAVQTQHVALADDKAVPLKLNALVI